MASPAEAEWPLVTRPNLFLIGAAKAATTSVHTFLGRHREVFMTANKEPHYFSSFELARVDERFFTVVRDPRAYRELFEGSEGARLRGESSTSYLSEPDAARAIHEFNSRAKVVAILRDPVERAYSQYLYNVREGTERRPFELAIDLALDGASEQWPRNYLQGSRYGAAIQGYSELFGSSLLVLFFEDLIRDRRAFAEALLAFLELDIAHASTHSIDSENPYGRPRNALTEAALRSPRVRLAARALVPSARRPLLRRALIKEGGKPPLERRVRMRLSEVLSEDVARLRSVLGCELPWETPS